MYGRAGCVGKWFLALGQVEGGNWPIGDCPVACRKGLIAAIQAAANTLRPAQCCRQPSNRYAPAIAAHYSTRSLDPTVSHIREQARHRKELF